MGGKYINCKKCGGTIPIQYGVDICDVCYKAEHGDIRCPECGNTDIVSCPGGTCYKPSAQAYQDIQWLCTNPECLNEFGYKDLK